MPANIFEAFSLEVFAKHFLFSIVLKIFHIKCNGFALLSFFPLVLLLGLFFSIPLVLLLAFLLALLFARTKKTNQIPSWHRCALSTVFFGFC